MSELDTRLTGLHLPAVLVAAALTFFSGGLWYSVLFTGPWIDAHGLTREQYDIMNAQVTPMLLAFAAYLGMAFVFAALARSLKVGGALEGVRLGIFIWLGFTATSALTIHVFSTNTTVAWLIDTGHQIVYLALMGAVIGHLQGRRAG